MSRTDDQIEHAITALQAGGVAILATDTVYGLVAPAQDAAAITRIYTLKNRPRALPLSLLAADVNALLGLLPDLDSTSRRAVAAVLPGPYTLILPVTGRFHALVPDANSGLGVRVPNLPEHARVVVASTGPLASTSANIHGDPDPAAIAAIPGAMLDAADAVVDDGVLPGTPSTVVDLTGVEPHVLREGAVPTHAAIEALTGRGR